MFVFDFEAPRGTLSRVETGLSSNSNHDAAPEKFKITWKTSEFNQSKYVLFRLRNNGVPLPVRRKNATRERSVPSGKVMGHENVPPVLWQKVARAFPRMYWRFHIAMREMPTVLAIFGTLPAPNSLPW